MKYFLSKRIFSFLYSRTTTLPIWLILPRPSWRVATRTEMERFQRRQDSVLCMDCIPWKFINTVFFSRSWRWSWWPLPTNNSNRSVPPHNKTSKCGHWSGQDFQMWSLIREPKRHRNSKLFWLMQIFQVFYRQANSMGIMLLKKNFIKLFRFNQSFIAQPAFAGTFISHLCHIIYRCILQFVQINCCQH